MHEIYGVFFCENASITHKTNLLPWIHQSFTQALNDFSDESFSNWRMIVFFISCVNVCLILILCTADCLHMAIIT